MKETTLKFHIHFPVKPYLHKFLTHKFGPCFVYSKTSILSPVIKSVLTESVSSELTGFQEEMYYEVIIPSHYFNKNSISFSADKAFQFNKDVDHLFREELYQFMVLNHEIYDIKFRTSFRDYLDKFDITENDVKYETLLKQFQRNHRQNDEQKVGTVS
ncbi:hypothetical protein [Flagellimonas sp.]|uniref:hypothetical protein n=1 Tax=Flagellimonas sp. TaxID=2058762 RepID=UPI003BADB08A